jgi:hypothetical protein
MVSITRWRSCVACLFDPVRDLAWVLKQIRFNILVLVIILAVMLGSDQIQDELIALGLDLPPVYLIGSFAAICWWAFNMFYWARFVLDFDYRERPVETCEVPALQGRDRRLDWLIANTPRIMGVVAFLVAIAGFAWVQQWVLAGALAVIAAVFSFLFMWRRRRLLNAVAVRRPKLAPFLAAADRPARVRRGWRDLPAGTWVFLTLNAAISIVLFAVLTFWPVPGSRLGTINLMLLGTTSWVVAGALLVLYGEWSRVPVLTLVAVYLLLISPFNDNHEVRHADGNIERPPLDIAFQRWNEAPEMRADLGGDPATRPVIIVATEGGGIRAAYWTAVLLSEIQRQAPNFRDRVFAISGVSGGAVGATVFEQLLEIDAAKLVCRDGSKEGGRELSGCSRAILAHDSLAPVIGAFLYPDLVQRLVPFPLLPDRAAAIEAGWEHAWNDSVPSEYRGRFGLPFVPYTGQAGGRRVPVLLLNGTSVNSGRRVITSNIKTDDGSFPDVVDFLAAHRSAIPISTAANNAARFPYIEPGGTFCRDRECMNPNMPGRPDRLVDGGYFENFGAVTAEDLIEHIERKKPSGTKIRWILIAISSDPDLGDYEKNELSSGCPAEDHFSPLHFATELTVPPAGLYATRSAHGNYAIKRLRWRIIEDLGGEYIPFRINKPKDVPAPPLGWAMSNRSREAIVDDLTRCPNDIAMTKLKALLDGSVPVGPRPAAR